MAGTAGSGCAPGRDGCGRFIKGNKLGKGNPGDPERAALKQAMVSCQTEEDFAELAQQVVAKARQGELAAIKLLLGYVLGRPRPGVDPDRVNLRTHAESAGVDLEDEPPRQIALRETGLVQTPMANVAAGEPEGDERPIANGSCGERECLGGPMDNGADGENEERGDSEAPRANGLDGKEGPWSPSANGDGGQDERDASIANGADGEEAPTANGLDGEAGWEAPSASGAGGQWVMDQPVQVTEEDYQFMVGMLQKVQSAVVDRYREGKERPTDNGPDGGLPGYRITDQHFGEIMSKMDRVRTLVEEARSAEVMLLAG